MIQIKNKITQAGILVLLVLITVSFNNQPFVLDGGTIANPFITFNPNTTPPPIIATEASGCTGTITYQWQQSFDATNFMDIAHALVGVPPSFVRWLHQQFAEEMLFAFLKRHCYIS